MEKLFGAAILLILLLFYIKTYNFRKYRRSRYHLETGNKRKKVKEDKGAAGEYETSMALEKVKGKKRFIFNAYIPKRNGKGSTETDIILIHEKGILVIENKNYQGWIYGRGDKYQWTHVLPGRKFSFYNPIFQNESHIGNLKGFLGKEYSQAPYLSVIIFNDQARLKRIKGCRDQAVVCNSRKAARKINRKLRPLPKVFTEEQIDEIYENLRTQSHVFRWVKAGHKRQVEKKKKCL